jgi:hypothetical protein
MLFLQHTLLVTELHVQLHEADRSRRIELLELTAEPACWRSWSRMGSQRLILKPDSFVRLGIGAYEDSWFVEIDRGTEGSRAILGQLQTYVAYYHSNVEQQTRGVFPRVLWTAETDQRCAVLMACVQQLPPGVRQLFQVRPFAGAVDIISSDEPPSTCYV